MKILLLCTKFLIERELQNAIRKIGSVQLINISLPEHTPAHAVPQLIEVLNQHSPDIVISLNCNGLDKEGKVAEHIEQLGKILAIWFVDDPLYYHIYKVKIIPTGKHTVYFASDLSYVVSMRALGIEASFLPLAFDPEYFNPEIGAAAEKKYDVVFVGNTSIFWLDKLMKSEEEKVFLRLKNLVADCIKAYTQDSSLDIRTWLHEKKREKLWKNSVQDRERFVYLVEWYVGYVYRKDFIGRIAKEKDISFFCYGDPKWEEVVGKDKTSFTVAYYDNLCATYHAAQINLNITRSQIRNGFTQRIFDCLASKCFLITDTRECNSLFFNTSGPEKELVQYADYNDAIEKVRYYLKNPEERQVIVEAGYKKVVKQHTYFHRLILMLEVIGKKFAR
jgi:spore maturation protein CgeB